MAAPIKLNRELMKQMFRRAPASRLARCGARGGGSGGGGHRRGRGGGPLQGSGWRECLGEAGHGSGGALELHRVHLLRRRLLRVRQRRLQLLPPAPPPRTPRHSPQPSSAVPICGTTVLWCIDPRH